MPNHLIHETSPYLLQHAHNPVEWYAWGPEALSRAKAEDKPILLSIGYSACHWCHVMEHESFEDEETARVMNAHFVSIKVDREERPDLDAIYMQAVQAISGHGGWPMTMFLTPDGQPFYGGTYYPPEPRHGMPAFTQVLQSVAQAYHQRRGDVLKSAGELTRQLAAQANANLKREELIGTIIADAVAAFEAQYDRAQGGFGGAPKFPQPMNLEFLLRIYQRTRYPAALAMVEKTLQAMARGGLYDQLGGGFHRYSVDAHWLVPHFEKMLYDNAQLARLYLHAYQATGKAFYARIATETLDYVLREMTHPQGGFYSTQDADSEGEEGKFYVWSPAEITAVLGAEDARIFAAYYDVDARGNFEGKTILNVPRDEEAVAQSLKIPAERLRAVIAEARPRLYAAREQRVHPGRDEKVLTAWNGLMLAAFAEAARVLDRDDYREAAVRNAEFLLENLTPRPPLLTDVVRRGGAEGGGEARLLRSWKDGKAKLNGYLEDYANLIDGLLALYEATFEARWLLDARRLTETIIAQFWSDELGGFYDTGNDHESLIARPRDVFDNATPSGGAVAALALQRLAVMFGEVDYARRAVESLKGVSALMKRYPHGLGQWLNALDFYLSHPKEIAVVGDLAQADTRALLAAVFGPYLPNKVVIHQADASARGSAMAMPTSPLLEGKDRIEGRATAYVCENYTCQSPVTDPRELAAQLE
ncbi:MAG: thioredoxin domain-containing protein [Chloroflexi bacterium]|nr:thioredoxin domain-containing protein [Chloroflexota bacterium]